LPPHTRPSPAGTLGRKPPRECLSPAFPHPRAGQPVPPLGRLALRKCGGPWVPRAKSFRFMAPPGGGKG